ncbi:7TM GPCR Srsx domain containing protein [Trichuris trichiura]|uniref:7TM GPCR Srsx domain containing protein n=1 Tax=Trichuris trichiura TaxID=36087 RepID=A0A077YZ87_TRITR|nr:7TM GPCR Srsx domain containing protein [Trichuris trichiura]
MQINYTAPRLEEVISYSFTELTFNTYLGTILGSVVCGINVLGFVAMMGNKDLRHRNSCIQIALITLAYAMCGIGSVLKSATLLHRLIGQAKPVFTERQCYFDRIGISVGTEMIVDISFFTAMDRCIAIFAAFFYPKTRSKFWICAELTIVFFHVGSAEWRLYHDTSDEPIAVCSIITASGNDAAVELLIEYNTLIVATVLIYTTLIAWIKWSIYKFSRTERYSTVGKYKQKSKLMLTLTYTVVGYVCTMLVGNTAAILAGKTSDMAMASTYLLISCANSFGGLVHFLILFYRMEEFHFVVLRLIGKKSFVVNPNLRSSYLMIDSGKRLGSSQQRSSKLNL